MALLATHVRFALDIKNKFELKNTKNYILGTIYPDSRYISKISRDLTHKNQFLSPKFAKNDFYTGWQVHQLCDIVQNLVRENSYLSLK